MWAFLDGWVGLVQSNSGKPEMVGLYTAMAVGALDAGHPGHPWLHEHFEQAVDALARALNRGKEQGAVAADAPTRQLARAIVAMSDGILIQWLCARADAHAGATAVGPTPEHGGVPLDMAEQTRLLIDMIKVRWTAPGASDPTISSAPPRAPDRISPASSRRPRQAAPHARGRDECTCVH
jgi:hypothetical protein